ncbi:MAG: carotenoid oxygenase family protein [Planctomycetota bacterium]
MTRFDLSRRDFVRTVLASSALGWLEPPALALALGDSKRLSFLANGTAGAEGCWRVMKIEGKIPAELNGTLYRTAPGQAENHGVVLRHIFDGDAYVSGWSFREGRAWMAGRFVETPEREVELKAGRMQYSEFGTNPPNDDGSPGPRRRDKNQPSVNLIHWDGQLLGLSEGGPPTAIDPQTLRFKSRWDFHGTMPPHSFTAHPKFDPSSGEGYAWGISRERGPTLMVYRLEADGKATPLHQVPLRGAFMVHDMALTKEHLVFLVPPLFFDRASMQKRTATPADALTYDPNQPIQLIVLGRAHGGSVRRFELPGGVLYHHGNAFVEGSILTMDTFLSDDNSLNELLGSFSAPKLEGAMSSATTRLRFNLEKGELVERRKISENQEFPRFDERRTGQDVRYLFTAEASSREDPLVFTHLRRQDLLTGDSLRKPAKEGRALGEPVFVPRPDGDEELDGWVLQQGFDGERSVSFIEIRDAGTLDLAARVWSPTNVPLGFHGNFVPNVFLDPPN